MGADIKEETDTKGNYNLITKKYVVKGLVQGIGFRPFVAEIAEQLHIAGWVRNTGGIVSIVASAEETVLHEFIGRIRAELPEGGTIISIDEQVVDNSSFKDFKIVESDCDSAGNLPLIPADIATCSRCEGELRNSTNRRYRHPFISCTVCGPRYSILEKLPYDRATITMSEFELCPECKNEYTTPGNIRRHAQTIACNECGPQIYVKNIGKKDYCVESWLDEAVSVVESGGILAIKDIGGYHLACDPYNEQAVANLRLLKHREAKAFAIMFRSVDEIKEHCHVNSKERELLTSCARPIVLLEKRQKTSKYFADNVCMNSPQVGAMLPCNPIQILLLDRLKCLVMTSGNGSGDVLEIDDVRMEAWLEKQISRLGQDISVLQIAHNRKILRPLDDSVVRVVREKTLFYRRARGYVPLPISVPIEGEIFAAGGDLKSSFCFVKNGLAYMSQHLGDLESQSCQKHYLREKDAMGNIFGFNPQVFVSDLHPGYYSRGFINDSVSVQHHKAHVAAVIAEHNIKGDVIGFAFDGTGYGEDGTVWGSETFIFAGGKIERVAHLVPVTLIGGDEGAKNCDTILAGFLHSAGIELPENEVISKAIDMGINSVQSTSIGRLFDAVSAMLGICHYNSYEGQAPVELEWMARKAFSPVDLYIGADGNTSQLFYDISKYISDGKAVSDIALGFIYAIASYIEEVVNKYQIHQVVLSGGTFLNKLLLERVIDILENEGYEVFFANQLPPGDGGLALGQAYLASRNEV